MFYSKSSKYILLVLAFSLVFSATGVFAAWQYYTAPVVAVEESFSISLFEWLPGTGSDYDDEESEINQAGTNHAVLVDTLVGEAGSDKASLNSSGSAINKTINSKLSSSSNLEGDINGKDTYKVAI